MYDDIDLNHHHRKLFSAPNNVCVTAPFSRSLSGAVQDWTGALLVEFDVDVVIAVRILFHAGMDVRGGAISRRQYQGSSLDGGPGQRRFYASRNRPDD